MARLVRGLTFRLIMLFLHRFGWHWYTYLPAAESGAPPIAWCSWCGHRKTAGE